MYEERQSLHACVDHYWRMTADEDGIYPQSISVQWGLLFIKDASELSIRLVGPRIKPVSTSYKKGETYWSIVFHGYIGLASITKSEILNKNILLTMVNERMFKLASKIYGVPLYEELDTFVEQLLFDEVLTQTTDVLFHMSTRTKQRRDKITTGLTPKQIEQANRVTVALTLIDKGLPLVDVAIQAGFADQAHMTREFNVLVGRTPAEIRSYYKK